MQGTVHKCAHNLSNYCPQQRTVGMLGSQGAALQSAETEISGQCVEGWCVQLCTPPERLLSSAEDTYSVAQRCPTGGEEKAALHVGHIPFLNASGSMLYLRSSL